MSVRDQLLDLQWAQLKHDEAYHKDIVILPVAQRMKHMSLHNAKYTGYFLQAVDQGDGERFHRTLIDAFIITLVVANTLNQDLGGEVDTHGGGKSLSALGADLAARLIRDGADPLWLVRQYAQHNGQLAKLCESWDHLEALPFRDGMKTCNLALFSAVLAEAEARGIDLADAYRARMRVVEARSIFDSRFRTGAGGEG